MKSIGTKMKKERKKMLSSQCDPWICFVVSSSSCLGAAAVAVAVDSERFASRG